MRTRAGLVAVLLAATSLTAWSGPPANAAPPPSGEPSLFVLRGDASYDDGVLTVRTRRVKWFADRPARDTGRMTTRELTEHWERFGFPVAPPNAAIAGDDVDAVLEVDAPRVTRGRIAFDVEVLDGDLASGDLGAATLFVDPSDAAAQQYSVRVVNQSSATPTMALYWQSTTGGDPQSAPLVWLAAPTAPSTTTTFTWTRTFDFSWGPGPTEEGRSYEPSQTWPADPGISGSASASAPGNIVELHHDGGFGFVSAREALPASTSLYTVLDNTIPFAQASVGIGIGGSPAFAGTAQPNYRGVFDTASLELWVTAGDQQRGEVIDLVDITNTMQIAFPPGVFAMTATLRADNTWVVQPGLV